MIKWQIGDLRTQEGSKIGSIREAEDQERGIRESGCGARDLERSFGLLERRERTYRSERKLYETTRNEQWSESGNGEFSID